MLPHLFSFACVVKIWNCLISETGCGNPGIPYLNVDRRFNFHTRLEFSCEEGYDMIGEKFTECLENGSWSIKTPECKSKLVNALCCQSWFCSGKMAKHSMTWIECCFSNDQKLIRYFLGWAVYRITSHKRFVAREVVVSGDGDKKLDKTWDNFDFGCYILTKSQIILPLLIWNLLLLCTVLIQDSLVYSM